MRGACVTLSYSPYFVFAVADLSPATFAKKLFKLFGNAGSRAIHSIRFANSVRSDEHIQLVQFYGGSPAKRENIAQR